MIVNLIAEYFDGESAQSHPVIIEREASFLLIRKDENRFERIRWQLNVIRVEHFGGGKVRLLHGSESLVLTPDQVASASVVFQDLFKKGRFEREKIPKYLAGVVGALILAYFVVNWGTGQIANLITIEHERWLFKGSIKSIKEMDCSTENENNSLWKIIKKLDDDTLIDEIIIIETDAPNAFAYPGGVVVFTTGFFKFAESENELLGVMAHELQHIKQRHHIKGLLKTGLISIIFKGATGGVDTSVISVAEVLASNKYHVEDERQADLEGARLLLRKKLSVEGLSTFFDRLSKDSGKTLKMLEGLISTHPSDEKRVEYLKPFLEKSVRHQSILKKEDWKDLQEACKSENE
jgi:Zn-dependent protease with chaperone function